MSIILPADFEGLATAAQPALDVCHVCKRYGTIHALADVSLSVGRGTVHGLVGVNGAGKTTLLRIVLGLVEPDSGSVSCLEQAHPTRTSALPDGVAGFVDAPSFYPYLSATQNLSLLRRLDRATSGTLGETPQSALARVGLSGRNQERVGGYSTGMRQRLAVAAALMRAPRLLVLDEPTSALDPVGARQVRTLIRSLRDAGMAVVLSSHDLPQVEEMCDDVTIIHGGRIVFTGPVRAVRERGASNHRLQTSNDEQVMALGRTCGLSLDVRAIDSGLHVSASVAAMDAFVQELVLQGIAIRRLEPLGRSLDAVFLELTNSGETSVSEKAS